MRSMIEHVAGIETERAVRLQANHLVHAARYLMLAKGSAFKAEKLAEHGRALEPIRAMIKAAVDAGSTGGWGTGLAQVDNGVSAFIESLRSYGAFDTALPWMTPVPIRTRVALVTTGVTAANVAEGSAKPISKLSLSSVSISETKCAAIIVASDELMRNASLGARLLGEELRKGIAVQTDAAFIAKISSGITPVTASGSAATAILTDIDAAMDTMTVSGNSKLFAVTSASIARAIRTKGQATNGGFAFPGGISGDALGPLTLLASDGAPSGQMIIFDAAALAADPGIVQIEAGNQATVEMDSAPTSPPVTSTIMVNLWQNDLSSIRAERLFAVERPSATSVAIIQTIAY